MQRAVDGLGAIEFVNLRGQFVQRGGKGLAFADSLKADYAAKVISVVLLDGDVGDNFRVLKKTLRDGKCFAPFFVSRPDFERANFTDNEVLEQLELFNRPPAADDDHEEMIVPVRETSTVGKAPRSPPRGSAGGLQSPRLPKSEAWGKALMNYALEHPNHPADTAACQRRQMLDAAGLLVRACRAGFQRSVDAWVVDETTGLFRARPPAGTAA